MFSIYVVVHENVILYIFHCNFILQSFLVAVWTIGNKSPLRTFLNNVFRKITTNLLFFFYYVQLFSLSPTTKSFGFMLIGCLEFYSIACFIFHHYGHYISSNIEFHFAKLYPWPHFKHKENLISPFWSMI